MYTNRLKIKDFTSFLCPYDIFVYLCLLLMALSLSIMLGI